jgi:hypothetical protein
MASGLASGMASGLASGMASGGASGTGGTAAVATRLVERRGGLAG